MKQNTQNLTLDFEKEVTIKNISDLLREHPTGFVLSLERTLQGISSQGQQDERSQQWFSPRPYAYRRRMRKPRIEGA